MKEKEMMQQSFLLEALADAKPAAFEDAGKEETFEDAKERAEEELKLAEYLAAEKLLALKQAEEEELEAAELAADAAEKLAELEEKLAEAEAKKAFKIAASLESKKPAAELLAEQREEELEAAAEESNFAADAKQLAFKLLAAKQQQAKLFFLNTSKLHLLAADEAAELESQQLFKRSFLQAKLQARKLSRELAELAADAEEKQQKQAELEAACKKAEEARKLSNEAAEALVALQIEIEELCTQIESEEFFATKSSKEAAALEAKKQQLFKSFKQQQREAAAKLLENITIIAG